MIHRVRPAPRRPRRIGPVGRRVWGGRRIAALLVATVAGVAACGGPGARFEDQQRAEAPPAATTTIAADELVFDSDRTGNFEIHVMRDDGSGVRQLTDDPASDSWWPRLSPDRRHILFYRTPPGIHDTDFTQTSLWVMNADGSDVRLLRDVGEDGWDQQGHAEWSPDGDGIVMFGGSKNNPQIFVTDELGREPRQVTERHGVSLDPSFSPDGSTIWFVGCPRAICFPRDYEIYAVPAAGGEAARFTDDDLRDHDPYVSPDGSRIAWLTQTDASDDVGAWNIRIAMTDDPGSIQRVTNDGHINSKPEWSSDGSILYFHRLVKGRDDGFGIWAVAPDGTGLREITEGHPGINEFPDA